MSRYENYDRTCTNYDATRVPVGLEIILGCLAASAIPFEQLRLLDAGCGTGAYIAALSRHIPHITAVDVCRGMLARTRERVAQREGLKDPGLCRAEIGALPFREASFDAAMINQVLHHLEAEDQAGFPRHRLIFREIRRVLRPGGRLLINTCSQEQLERAYWYYALIPRGAAVLRRRFMPLDTLKEALEACGFHWQGRYVPLDECFQGDAYLDVCGPLKDTWRDGDSVFSLARPEELAEACRQIRRMKKEGTLQAFAASRDQARKRLGQVTFVLASKA